jgi:hypothetical protein
MAVLTSMSLRILWSYRLTSGDDQRREGRESGPTRRLVHRLVSPPFASMFAAAGSCTSEGRR